MESVYTRFFNGKPSSFGIGTWNNYQKSLNQSGILNSTVAPPLPSVLSKNINNHFNSDNSSLNQSLAMQLLEYKLKKLEEKDNQISQMSSLYNSQCLPSPYYYPPLAQPQIDPYYSLNLTKREKEPYQKKRTSLSKIKLNQKKIASKSLDQEGIARLKAKLMPKNNKYINISGDESIDKIQTNNAEETKENIDRAKNKKKEEDDIDIKEINYIQNKLRKLKVLNGGKHFIKDLNENLALKLQRDTHQSKKGILELKENYNEMKSLLENKLNQFELRQRQELEILKSSLEQEAKKNHTVLQRREQKVDYNTIVENKIKEHDRKKERERRKKEELEQEIRKKVAEEIKLQKMLKIKQTNVITYLPPISYEPTYSKIKNVNQIVDEKVNEIMKDKEIERLLLLNGELIRREDFLLSELKREISKRKEEEKLRQFLEMKIQKQEQETVNCKPIQIEKKEKEIPKEENKKTEEENKKELNNNQPVEEEEKEQSEPEKEEDENKQNKKNEELLKENLLEKPESPKAIQIKLGNKEEPKKYGNSEPLNDNFTFGYERVLLSDIYPEQSVKPKSTF